MNNERRKEIKKAIDKIESLLQNILEQEQEAYENMPEGLQEAPNGLASMEAQENLESAIDALTRSVH
jgi:hypothetical protein